MIQKGYDKTLPSLAIRNINELKRTPRDSETAVWDWVGDCAVSRQPGGHTEDSEIM